MARNISFSLTTEQIRNRTKTVTRRKGWRFLKVGDVLNACVKCMGLQPGEKIERLGKIKVVGLRREPLWYIGDEAYGPAYEGFPQLDAKQFVEMFCHHMGGDGDQFVTRIEFEYVDSQRMVE